ncbi:hypothetical protein BKA61DRAFT_611436 [Leptodontidium sp. MPI-SDFR-AT-0119]|nr:hypothetical protein BKA61DRAFT_611436 [Leptodontidium sp. MPI-SDFR-AT-0119]
MATLAPTVTLTSKREMFPPWLYYVDPDGPDSPHTADLEPALPPTIKELIHIEDKHRQNTWEVDIRDILDKPAILLARFKDIKKEDAYLDVLETTLARAKSLKLDVIKGTSAIQTFLETVTVRVAPEWMTTTAKKRLDRKGTRGGGVYVTLGGRSDSTNKCPCSGSGSGSGDGASKEGAKGKATWEGKGLIEA